MSGLGEELRPGLRRWTARREEWGEEVAAHALVGEGSLVLVDPLLEGAQWEELEELAAGREVDVVLTVHWHARSAAAVAERFRGARVWAHSRDRAACARRAPVTDVYRAGGELPGGLAALQGRPRTEAVLWDPHHRALLAGDVLLGDGNRGAGLHTCPESWLHKQGALVELREAMRPALKLPVELVLPSHGEPVLEGGLEALRDVVEGRG